MFVAARGGAGGKGNHFFTTDIEQAPQISEFGAKGEDLRYVLEIKSMAHMGLVSLSRIKLKLKVIFLIISNNLHIF